MKLAANRSKFKGLELKPGKTTKPAPLKLKSSKAAKPGLSFKAKKSKGAIQLQALSGAKFQKSPKSQKTKVGGGSQFTVRKMPGKSDNWSLKKVDRASNTNAKMVFPGSKLKKTKSEIRRAYHRPVHLALLLRPVRPRVVVHYVRIGFSVVPRFG